MASGRVQSYLSNECSDSIDTQHVTSSMKLSKFHSLCFIDASVYEVIGNPQVKTQQTGNTEHSRA